MLLAVHFTPPPRLCYHYPLSVTILHKVDLGLLCEKRQALMLALYLTLASDMTSRTLLVGFLPFTAFC